MQIAERPATRPAIRVTPKPSAEAEALVIRGRREDMLALSERAARRFATDLNRDGRISSAEAEAFAQAAGLPQAPGLIARWLDKLGLKKLPETPTEIKLPVAAQASAELVAARAAQARLARSIGAEAAAGLDWTNARIEKAGATTRVAVKAAQGEAVHTLLLSREGGQLKATTQLESALAKAGPYLADHHQTQVATAIVKELADRSSDGFAPEFDWGSFRTAPGPLDSDLAELKSTAGKTYRFYVAWNDGEAEHLFVAPAQLLALYHAGHEDWDTLKAGDAMLRALDRHGADGWPPELDWTTLSVTKGADEAVVGGSVKEQGTGTTFGFTLKRQGDGLNATYDASLIRVQAR